jgi:hypothetical protein
VSEAKTLRGGHDPAELGRRGGVVSGQVRRGERPKAQTRRELEELVATLEAQILASGSGYAKLTLLKEKRAELARLEREEQQRASSEWDQAHKAMSDRVFGRKTEETDGV